MYIYMGTEGQTLYGRASSKKVISKWQFVKVIQGQRSRLTNIPYITYTSYDLVI